ncbi:MAG: type II toxin-antitoxin system RelE/ParE family toxin [Burkholderiales bacterium]|nr:MAG: type II toxin-antitoxin system RelE/ParE family toxin [Burkholderiales bacterium]
MPTGRSKLPPICEGASWRAAPSAPRRYPRPSGKAAGDRASRRSEGVALVVPSARALADLERIVEFLREIESGNADAALATVLDALTVLERHRLIGRPVDEALRELIIGYGRAGYVALYRHRRRLDRVEVLAVRHQRETGYG